jgi:hypothetical protein
LWCGHNKVIPNSCQDASVGRAFVARIMEGRRAGGHTVSEQPECPYCGYPLARSESAAEASQAAVIESMDREIRKLRETVAMLRGARAG